MKDETHLLPGEAPIPKAPRVKIKEDIDCIPQHYLTFNHSVESVEHLLVDIEYSDNYPIFVSADESCLYLQVGIIGYDNYRPKAHQQGMKIVYGRKWRVEPQLPTSEIIQTAFLALVKAREHEVRELFRLETNTSLSSPFSNHHDLPLMAKESNLLVIDAPIGQPGDILLWLQQLLDKVTYDSASFHVTNALHHSNDRWIIDLNIEPKTETQLPELQNTTLTLLLNRLSEDELYYELMDTLLAMSRRHVEEHFRYKGFNRFSRNHAVTAIGQLSSITRRRESVGHEDEFAQTFSNANYETDLTRVPRLGNGPLSNKLREQLSQFHIADGILPE